MASANPQSSNGENHLQIVQIENDIICRCQRGSLVNNNQLYFCKSCEDDHIYCERCGPFYHDEDHEFKITPDAAININALIVEPNNEQRGLQTIRNFIGNARYNQIASFSTKVGFFLADTATVSFVGIELIRFFKNASQTVLFTKSVFASNVIGVAVISFGEMALNGYRYVKGDITGKEWCRRAGKTITRNSITFCGCVGGAKVGAKIGALLGTALAPGVGTAIGCAGGIVLGMIVGAVAGYGAQELYEKFFPSDRTEKDHALNAAKDALLAFNWSARDIENIEIFNKKELDRRYKRRALEVHPDRTAGDSSQWHALSSHYGILRGILEDGSIISRRIPKMSNRKIVTKGLTEESKNN